MAVAARAMLLLSLLAVSASGLREVARQHQQAAQSKAASSPQHKVGDFMQYQVLEGPDAGSWVKCAITGLGDLPDTYNVYVWSAEPHRRNLKNIPVEVMRTQAEQDAKQKAIDVARRRAREEEEARRRAKELAERQAREAEEARRAAEEAAERKAKIQAEIKRREEEEAKRLADEAEARRLAEEEAERQAKEKAERDEAARLRKIQLKAKWEQVKAAKKAAAEKAAEEEAQHWAEEAAARRTRGNQPTTTRPLADPENIKVIVKFDGQPDVSLKVKRNLRLRLLMSVAAEKFGVDLQDVRFVIGKKVFSPEETAERFGHNDKAVLRMEKISFRERASSLRLMSQGVKSFETGDFVQANLTDSRGGVLTVPFTVSGRGSSPDSFDIHFMFPTGGRQDFPSFPARLLSKVRGRDYAASVKSFRESPELAARAATMLARYLPAGQYADGVAEAKHRPGGKSAAEREGFVKTPSFQVGDFVEFKLQDRTMMPATITTVVLGVAGEPTSYNLHMLFAPAAELHGLRDLHAVPEKRLSRIQAQQYVEAVHQLKEDPPEARRVLELAAKELNGGA